MSLINKNVFIISAILIYACATNAPAQNSNFEWIHQAGGKSNERGTAIELDTFGNVYCTGAISDTTYIADTMFVTTFDNVFISKFSSAGDLQWIRVCGGPWADRGLDLKVDGNNDVIVTGYFKSIAQFADTSLTSLGLEDVFIAKYNSQGDFQWVVQGAGSDPAEGYCLATDINNNIYIGGYFEGSLQIGSFNLLTDNFSSMFLAKISPAGNVLWVKQAVMQDFGESFALDLICDTNGDVIVTGNFNDTGIFQDTTLYSYDGNEDIFIIKYDSSGNKIWIVQAGGNYDDYGKAITVDELGNIYLAGQFRNTASFGNITLYTLNNNTDMFYAMLSPSGAFQWVKQSTGIFTDRPSSIFYNKNHGLAICGGYIGEFTIGDSTFNNSGTEDIFLANITTAGTFKSAISIGEDGDDDLAYDVCLDDNGFIYMTGIFHHSILFGDSLLVSHGLADAFITKINLNQISNTDNTISTVPAKFTLLQNYPNPFNPMTTIQFDIPKAAFVTLKVYNVLGQEVAKLVNEKRGVGKYEAVFDGSKLASGVYFYRLQTIDYINTKKLLLIK